jgi:RimJ/RimL family protein N-acetyltransferase
MAASTTGMIGRMTRPTLTTQRIRLVPMTTEHLPLLVGLDADPDVLRHILGRGRDEQEVRSFWGPICADTAADAVGLGWWVGFRRDTDDFLGWWDLSPDVTGPERPTRAEAGWRLSRQHWRHGYATEGAAALLDHGFHTIGLDMVWAETMTVNEPSRGVMVKLGMRHVRTDHRAWDDPLPGSDQGEVVYEITREEWIRRDAWKTPRRGV